MDEHNEHELSLDVAAALARLRRDAAPATDLWPGVAARIADEDRTGRMSELRVDIAPSRELWVEIQQRIRQRHARRIRAPWLAAAGLAASLVVVLGLKVSQDRGSTLARAPIKASAGVVALTARSETMPALRTVSRRSLTPETRALLRANLKIVSSAEVQLKRAREADPDSVYLDNLLSTARQQKQDLRYALAER